MNSELTIFKIVYTPKDLVHRLEKVRGEDGIWYVVPEELRALNFDIYKPLKEVGVIKTALNELSKELNVNKAYTRRIKLKLNSEKLAAVRELFYDEDDNLILNGKLLEETDDEERRDKNVNVSNVKDEALEERIKNLEINLKKEEENAALKEKIKLLEEKLNYEKQEENKETELEKKIKELEKKLTEIKPDEINLRKVERNLIIKKYDHKQDAKEWLEAFKEECETNKVIKDSDKIKLLKMCIDDSISDWYSTCARKLDLNWSSWCASFIKVFGQRTWSDTRFTINYKYLKGSPVDYALKKQRMLLDENPDMDDGSMIRLIVYGLPQYYDQRLDKQKINKTDDLIEELGKLEKTKLTYQNSNNHNNNNNYNLNKRLPCKFCEALGFKNRFHKLDECRNKNDDRLKKLKANLNEIENDPTQIDVENLLNENKNFM